MKRCFISILVALAAFPSVVAQNADPAGYVSAGEQQVTTGGNDPAEEDFAPLFPFLISYDGLGGAVSMGHLLDAPAGKDGFIRIEEGRFVNDAGRIRFYGTNLTGAANFPESRDADMLAERLANFGINCVRLHYLDTDYGNFMEELQQGIIAPDPSTQRNFDPAQLEKMDYLVAAFKKKGIYVNINLHVRRFWDERDCFTGQDQRPNFDKGLDNFEPRMIELQKEYARKLLTHVNPYTGLAYTDDPCVAMVEINNENSLIHQYRRGSIDRLTEPYSTELQRQWNRWLQEKRPGKESDIPVPKRTAGNTDPEIVRDFHTFMIDTENEYWTGMYRYLKDDLKVRSAVAGTQLGFDSPFVQARLDYVDNHAYWCHPGPVNANWKIQNESMVNSLSSVLSLAAQRVHGKPYTISEYNHPFPNLFGAEAQPMLSAYAALQGWDGIFEYTYNHRSDPRPEFTCYFFSMAARTDLLAHLPACSAIYLRGDVNEARSQIVVPAGFEPYFDKLAANGGLTLGVESGNVDRRYGAIHKVSVDLQDGCGTECTPKPIPDDLDIFVSDTEELVWNTEMPDAGYFTVNTPHTKLFSGFPAGRVIRMGDVSLSVGKTRLDWATVSLVSRNGAGFGEGKQRSDILLSATGLFENRGMVVERHPDNKISLSDWGSGGVLVEGIRAAVCLPSDPSRTKCFALGPDGRRKAEIPVESEAGGRSRITISPDYATVWYEIVIDPVPAR